MKERKVSNALVVVVVVLAVCGLVWLTAPLESHRPSEYSLERGLRQAAEGRLHSRGDFERYADDNIDGQEQGGE